ncbi:MAG TPA: MaoC/PaaZ C-terminal domain-containing protein [Actinomycetota bacterium]|nr:MaoC/PaaZ C-terminal domain-containing protein [Actinomycetota bacterium]
MAARIRFEDVRVGEELPPLSRTVRREDVAAYAEASGDRNPLHLDDAFARAVGFPGVIAHGMFTMALVVKALTDWLGDPGALKAIRVQFRAVVFMDETVVVRARVESLDPASRRARLAVWAEVEREGERVLAVKNSEAEVALA